MWGRRSPQRDGDCGVGSPAQGPAVLGGDGHQDARSGSGRSLAHSPAGGPVPLGFRHRLSRRHRSGEEAYRRAGTQLRPLRPPGAGAEAEGGHRTRRTDTLLPPARPRHRAQRPFKGRGFRPGTSPSGHGISRRHLLGLGPVLPAHPHPGSPRPLPRPPRAADVTQGQLPGTEQKATSSHLFQPSKHTQGV